VDDGQGRGRGRRPSRVDDGRAAWTTAESRGRRPSRVDDARPSRVYDGRAAWMSGQWPSRMDGVDSQWTMANLIDVTNQYVTMSLTHGFNSFLKKLNFFALVC